MRLSLYSWKSGYGGRGNYKAKSLPLKKGKAFLLVPLFPRGIVFFVKQAYNFLLVYRLFSGGRAVRCVKG